MNYFFLISLFFCQLTYAMNHLVMVGDEQVKIKHIAGRGKTFIHVHHNEQTALKAAQAVIRKEGGSLITLEHSGGRNIVFHLHNKRYEFDPNRIYTDQGIKKTLSALSHYTPAAHREVKKLADKIKQLLPKGKVIAVHNNASYSLKDYLPGNSLEQDAQAIHILPRNYYRNFYLVTKIGDFLRLKSQGYNGVLQKKTQQQTMAPYPFIWQKMTTLMWKLAMISLLSRLKCCSTLKLEPAKHFWFDVSDFFRPIAMNFP